MPLNSPCQDVGFTCPFVVIDPTYLGPTTVVAPGLMLDNFLPIPDAESLPFYPSVLKLVVCTRTKSRNVATLLAVKFSPLLNDFGRGDVLISFRSTHDGVFAGHYFPVSNLSDPQG